MIGGILFALLLTPFAAAVSLVNQGNVGGAYNEAGPVGARFEKIVVVVLEKADFKDAVTKPFLLYLTKSGALLADYHGVAHPSQPNYVALVAGDTLEVEDDGEYDLNARSLVDLLEKVGRDWRVYAEGYPGGCFLKPRLGRYVRKHVPFLSLRKVQKSPKRCGKIVEGKKFFADVSAGKLADFSLYVPDLSNGGHDTDVAFADNWLKEKFGLVLDKLPRKTLLVVTFDEDSEANASNHVYTALYGPMVLPGARSDLRHDHYSLLKMIEDAWGLDSLGAKDAVAAPIEGVWR